MAEKPSVERGNPVIPDAPVPSMVRMSMVPEPPIPVPKMVDGEVVVYSEEGEDGMTDEAKETVPRVEEEVDAKPKGIIVIKVFENSPYEVEFSGMITGSEIDIAWKAMMKEYRVWKHNLFKKETADKNGGV